MNVLSLFDGISVGQLALRRCNIHIDNYYASEVDKHAIATTKYNFPSTLHLGDVRNINVSNLPQIDLLIGGSPCTDLSTSGKMKGMSTIDGIEIFTLENYLANKNKNIQFTGQSYLFWEYIRILQEVKPKYFLLENVKMKIEYEKLISSILGVEPIIINSATLSAQNRVRYYWTNISGLEQPIDANIHLSSILDDNEYIYPSGIRGRRINKEGKLTSDKSYPIQQCLEVSKNNDKSFCITTVSKDNVLSKLPHGRYIDHYKNKYPIRNYSIAEYCKLQTLPVNYFPSTVSDNQIRKMIGNSWTVDVIKHIFSYINI